MASSSAAPAGHGLLRQGRTLSMMLTFACTAECTHCSTLSSPRNRDHLPAADALRAIDEAAELGFVNVVFTGGEATLRWDDLLTCIGRASGHGLRTRLVTNAHWALTPEAAETTLDRLLDAGLDEINFSTGDEHARFVPLPRVAQAAAATARRGLTAHVMVELRHDREVTAARLLAEPAIQELEPEARALVRPSESPWMPVKPFKVERYPDGVASRREDLPKLAGCDSVLQTYTVQPNGRVAACCGLAMRLVPELNVGEVAGEHTLRTAIDEAEDDLLKLWLRAAGPEAILAWASDRDPEIAWEGMYGHRCQACLRLYKDPRVRAAIVDGYEEEIPAVVQAAWLKDRYVPSRLSELFGATEDPARPASPTSSEAGATPEADIVDS
ncbi:radical SAM protein [Microbispora sp. NBC_01389]|uniref:radical SAM protein n=1 Tax=Microbispora sp. NBC_01389 TaxID=2903584 RepID=UPI0032458734